jgi:DTW domain-containing protein YfiP
MEKAKVVGEGRRRSDTEILSNPQVHQCILYPDSYAI